MLKDLVWRGVVARSLLAGMPARSVFQFFSFSVVFGLCEGPQRPMCGGFCDGLEND